MRNLMLILVLAIGLNIDAFANKQTKYEVRLGSNVAATILGKYKQSNDTDLIKYVNLVGQTVVKTSGRKDIHFYFTVLNEAEPMALACPGGYIFISTGLLSLLTTEAQLAGVLAHEIAHVNEKHAFDKVQDTGNDGASMLTQMLMAQHTSASVAFGELSNKVTTILLDKGLNEDDEYEADVAALIYLKNTGYAPEAYIEVIERLPAEKVSHSKTHPDINDRIKQLKSLFPNDFLDDGKILKERFDNYAINN
ncbi:MAG: M48 family metalloprotease [Candidatus Margulisiibacteriota bacterium]